MLHISVIVHIQALPRKLLERERQENYLQIVLDIALSWYGTILHSTGSFSLRSHADKFCKLSGGRIGFTDSIRSHNVKQGDASDSSLMQEEELQLWAIIDLQWYLHCHPL